MKTVTVSDFDPRFPFAVLSGHVVDGVDMRNRCSCCCRRAAEDEATTMRAKGRMNVEVVELRPVPTRGAFGGWRVATGIPDHNCAVAPRVTED